MNVVYHNRSQGKNSYKEFYDFKWEQNRVELE